MIQIKFKHVLRHYMNRLEEQLSAICTRYESERIPQPAADSAAAQHIIRQAAAHSKYRPCTHRQQYYVVKDVFHNNKLGKIL